MAQMGTPQAAPLAAVIARSVGDESFRAALLRDPGACLQSEGVVLPAEQLAALRALRAPVFGWSDQRLERHLRSTDSLDAPVHRAAVGFLTEYRARVLSRAAQFLKSLDVPAGMLAMLRRSLHETEMMAAMVPCLPAIDFPVAVYACHAAEPEEAAALSVAGLFYYMGISLLDDVVDRDLAGDWQREPADRIGYAAIAMFSGLPAMALSHFRPGGGAPQLLARLAFWLQEASFEVAAGQYLDISARADEHATPDACIPILLRKTGSTGRLAARMGAALASVPEAEVEAYARAGCDLYVSMQIVSDLLDIWGKPVSPDLANGILTIPIAFACGALRGAERARFCALLASRQETRERQAVMRELATNAGALRYGLVKAESYRQRAIAALSAMDGRALGLGLLSYLVAVARPGEATAGGAWQVAV